MRLHAFALLLSALLLMQLQNAGTAVKTEDCSINFTVHIALVGNGTSEAFAQRVKDGINNYWNRNFTCKECKCKAFVWADVIMMRGGSCMTVSPSYHCVTVTETATWLRSGVRRGPWENGEIASGDGEWDTLDTENVIAHETGHYLGNRDEYQDHYTYSIKDASGAVVSGPHYTKAREWDDAKRAEIEGTAPAGGSIEYVLDGDGNKEIDSRLNDGADPDSLMADSTNAAHVVKQYHFDRMCNDSHASCGNECCCGNARFEPDKGESCDPKARPTGCAMLYTCRQNCTCAPPPVVCGDGRIDAQRGEKCDTKAIVPNGGCANGSECSQNCNCIPIDTSANASNSTNRTIPPGNDSIPPIGNDSIQTPRCGNGVKETGEACDGADRGTCLPAQSCSSSCTCVTDYTPGCGNNVRDAGEQCDGGIGCDAYYHCTAQCVCERTPRCGDGIVDIMESCDGSNAGCPSGYYCSGCRCEQTPVCSESWSCGEWGAWGEWDACPESGTQGRARARTCTDANNCGTTNSKPGETETETRACTYTPTHQKEAYTGHENALGERISNLDYNGASATRDLSSTGGEYGYRILGIPSHTTITVCVSGSGPLSLFQYPQYPYGFDFTDTTPGCTDIYNKNNWANGVLVHLGDPTPANVNSQITVAKK